MRPASDRRAADVGGQVLRRCLPRRIRGCPHGRRWDDGRGRERQRSACWSRDLGGRVSRPGVPQRVCPELAGPPVRSSRSCVSISGGKVPSPALFNKIGLAFRKAVLEFAEVDDIPLIRFAKADRKIDVVRPYLDAASEPGVVAIGIAQEFQSVFTGHDLTAGKPGPPRYSSSSRLIGGSASSTSTSGTPSSGRGSSSCAPTSRIQPRCG